MAVADLVFIDSTGYHFADFPSFLSYVQTSFQAIYGADVYLGSDSQDGQWTSIIAQMAFDCSANGSSVYSSFSPVTAQGAGLARNVKINGITKGVPTNSVVDVTIVGVAGTTITNGVAVDTLNQQWALPASVTIPGGGSIDVTATAVDKGAIAAVPGSVTGIFTPTLGWQTVNNSAAATPGAPVESDAQLRIRQQQSTSLPALTVLEATTGALENLTGVTQVMPYENDTDSTDANGLTPHSVCFVVEGGDLQQIANTIGLYKTPGTNTFESGANGRNEIYTDPRGLPVPINFISPAINATIGVEITVVPLTAGWSSDFEALIAAAVATYISTQVKIGGTVIWTNLFLPAALVGTPAFGTYYVSVIEIKKNAGSFAAANIALLFDEIPVCAPSNVAVST